MVFMMFSVTAFAMSNERCVIKIEEGNRAATGLTECHSAIACSATVTGCYGDGVNIQASSHGVSAANAGVTASSKEFCSAKANHRIEFYVTGIWNVYHTVSEVEQKEINR